jgi:hypothetical protein
MGSLLPLPTPLYKVYRCYFQRITCACGLDHQSGDRGGLYPSIRYIRVTSAIEGLPVAGFTRESPEHPSSGPLPSPEYMGVDCLKCLLFVTGFTRGGAGRTMENSPLWRGVSGVVAGCGSVRRLQPAGLRRRDSGYQRRAIRHPRDHRARDHRHHRQIRHAIVDADWINDRIASMHKHDQAG